jgi:hypothetical protein
MRVGDCFICSRSEGQRVSVILRREPYRALFLHDDGTEEWRDIDDLRTWVNPYYRGDIGTSLSGDENDIRRQFLGITRCVRERQERLAQRRREILPERGERGERTRVIDIS